MRKFNPTGVFAYVLGSRSCADVSEPMMARETTNSVALRQARDRLEDTISIVVQYRIEIISSEPVDARIGLPPETPRTRRAKLSPTTQRRSGITMSPKTGTGSISKAMNL
jgi:hypothetical protein